MRENEIVNDGSLKKSAVSVCKFIINITKFFGKGISYCSITLIHISKYKEKYCCFFRMDSSRLNLPNVDRANSTLFKRYLEEQHKSVIKPSNHQQMTHPIRSTIQITHTYQQQKDDIYASKLNDRTGIIKRKYSNGRKPLGDTSKPRTSHTSRFMKRFQRQHKSHDTIANVEKRGL